jgi:hypothetical protein
MVLPPWEPKITLERIGSIGKTQGVNANARPKIKKAKNNYAVEVFARKRPIALTSSRSRHKSARLNWVLGGLTMFCDPSSTSGIGAALTPGPASKKFMVVGG